MPIEVEVPGIGVVEFPDGMPDEQIAQAIKSNFPQQAAPERSLLSKVVGALPAVQVGAGVARIAAKQMGYPLAPPSGAEPAPLGERMTRAFSTGMGGATEALGGSAEMMGMTSIGQPMQEAGRSIQKPTRGIEDVDWGSGLDVLSFAGESVLEQTPNLAILATAILGGSAVAGSLGASAAVTAGAARAAAATAGFLLEAGDTYTNLRALGVEPEKAALSANIAGAGKALLEAAVPVMVGKSLKWIPTEAAMKRPTLWKEITKGGAVSAGTEAAQEVVDIEAEVLNNVNDQSAGANLMRIANAGAKGLFGEGPFTTLAAVQEVRNYEPPPELQDYAPPPEGPSTPRTEVEGPSLPDPKLSEADLPKAVAERLQVKTIEELTKPMRPWELRKALGYGADTSIGALRAAGIIDKGPEGYVFTKAVLEEVALRQEAVKTEVDNFLDTLPEEVQDAPTPAPPAPTGSLEGMTFETENELPAADPEYITSSDVAETVMDATAQGVYFQLTGIVENPASTPEQVQFAKDSLRTVHEKIAKLTPGARLTFRGEDRKFEISPETVQRGQPLFKVESGRTTPASPITLADVQRVAQGQQVEQLDGGFRVRLANGKVMIIAFTGEIEVDAEAVAADYGPNAPVGPAIASYEPIPFGGLIQLTNYADLGALRHEWFHSAMAMALTEQERVRVLGTYKSEEVAAEAYVAWAGRGEAPHSLFKKIQKFFRDLLDRLLGRTSAEVRAGVEQDIFSRIESGEVWTAHGDFPAWEQDEIMARRALAKFAWIPPSDATALSPEQEVVVEDFKRLFKLAPKEQRDLIQKDVGRWFRGARHLIMVHQLRDVFKNYAPLERMIKQIEQYWQTKNEVLMPAHKLIEHMWMKLSNKDLALHGKLTIHVGNLSYKEKRRLGKHEVIAEAKKLGAAGRDILDLYFAVDAEYRNALGRLFKAVEAQLVRSSPDPILTAISRRRLAKEFASLMERNYFPATRFGKFGVRVTATKGFTDASGKKWRKNSRVYFGTEDSAKGQEQLLAKVTKEYAALPVRVGTSYIHDAEHSLIGLPPMLQDMLIGNLNLTEQQQIELHELTYVLAPSHSYVKHMMQRANTPGFSMDLMRVFANYFQHLSNHIARIETRAGMDEALLAVKQDADTATAGRSYGLLYESLAKTMSYLYNPGNEMSMLRGGLFLYYFAFMPVQAVVNLTQLPLMTYPYLAKKYGDRAALSIAGNVARVKDLIDGKNLDPEMQAALEYGRSTGILTEYLAAEVASVADGGLFSGRRSPQLEHKIRKAAEFSTKPFKVSEGINRYVTYMSAYELARKAGASVEAAQEEAKIATQITQGEYARWNRMPVARGRMGAVLIFKSYAQLLTYFAITNKGGWRFWFMLIAMAGLKGVPGAEDIWEIINLLGTKFKEALGLKDPKVDAERELRKFATEIGMNPDLLMNGVSKYGFGLQAMEWLFGIPMPALDFSTKMQMGKLVPGLSTTAKALQGQMDSKTYMAQVFTEMLGAGANVWGGFTRSIIEPKTDGSLLKAVALNGAPSAVKNVMRAVDIGINGGYRDARGNLLVPYNLSNPAHLAEIVGQAAGVTSNRVTKERESYGLSKERVQYIQTRREVLLGAFAGARDAEDLAEARDAVKAYNASVDPRERITVDQLYASRQARQRARALRERGFPTTLRYRYLFEEDRKLFLTPFEKEAREIPQR